MVPLGLNFSIRGAHCGLIVLDYGGTDDAGGFDRQEASYEFISVLNQSVRGPQQLHYHLENMLTNDQTKTVLDLNEGFNPS